MQTYIIEELSLTIWTASQRLEGHKLLEDNIFKLPLILVNIITIQLTRVGHIYLHLIYLDLMYQEAIIINLETNTCIMNKITNIFIIKATHRSRQIAKLIIHLAEQIVNIQLQIITIWLKIRDKGPFNQLHKLIVHFSMPIHRLFITKSQELELSRRKSLGLMPLIGNQKMLSLI